MPDQTLERIKSVRVDALYGKKKHFNAAERKRRYQANASIAVILINLTLGSALFLSAKDAVPECMKWVGGLFALGAAALAALQAYFSWPKMAQGHSKVGAQYLILVKECSNVLARHGDSIISDSQLGKELEKLTNELSKVNEAASNYPTNGADYQIAKEGLDSGEEEYTERERATGG